MQAALWVIGSVLAYVAAVHISWRLDWSSDNAPAAWQRWKRWGGSPGATALLRALYYVGVPYAAMLLGAADFPLHMGLAGLNWPTSIGRGALAGLGIFLGMVGIAGYSLRGLRRRDAEAVQSSLPSHGAALVYEALFLEAHWAFYRLPGILATGDFLLGTWIGAAVAVIEQVADPRWRSRASSKRFALEAWQRFTLLVGMSAVFFFTRNFWVAWAVHALVEWGRVAATRQLLRRVEGRAAIA